ncbi:hypothetical protein AHMF7616_00594 [Adhaeribacter pallidiroseus]|uniref:Uncharacterized protein n=2 Tax=Adhaeribacter pallidiroseus TaxID=2072847 RepID=A0A369QBB5_9BACT|nr:hypothetical protein AHMF7616_00594 [Adhaeribacter pallidiroseus]
MLKLKQSGIKYVLVVVHFLEYKFKLQKKSENKTMKNLIKTPVIGYAIAFGLAATQLSCSSDSKNTAPETTTSETVTSAANDGETAYMDYKNYVSTLDSSTIATMDTASTGWHDQRTIYQEKTARLDQYRNDYDATRQQEIDQLKNRYDSYWGTNLSGGKVAEKINNTTADVQRAGAKVGDKVEQGAENAGQAVKETGKDAKETADNVASRVGTAAKNTAEDAKETGNKVGSKVGTAAKNTAQDVAQTGEKVGSKVGNAAKNTAQDVAHAGEKVGHAAKETGKDVKEGVVKGAKAVGKTADKAGAKVKDAFDGKKENE